MAEPFERNQDKTAGDLTREAFRYAAHTVAAVLVLAVLLGVVSLFHPNPEADGPKVLCSYLSFLVPLAVAFAIARYRPDNTAQYVWISGVLTFAIVCVWVLDLPTGNGLCERCGALEKLTRTFFAIDNGSGLMAGDGLLVGTWIPLSMIGYAAGARFGYRR